MENDNRKKRGEKKNKVILVFDPKARREYLTGFRKRKQDRRKRAQEQLDRMLKQEKRSIKKKTKEVYQRMVAPYQVVREQAEHLLKEEHDMGSHSVEITELSPFELAKQNNWIGSNQVKYEDKEEVHTKGDTSDSEAVPGMELEEKPSVEKKVEPTEELNFKSLKDLKRTVRLQATKQVQKSKAFKTLGLKEKMKNKKRSKKEKREKERALKKSKKHKLLKSKSSNTED